MPSRMSLNREAVGEATVRTRRFFLCGALSKRLGGPWVVVRVTDVPPETQALLAVASGMRAGFTADQIIRALGDGPAGALA